jgi:hypothetical protein
MKKLPITLAFVFALTLLPIHPARAGTLSADLNAYQAVYTGGIGVGAGTNWYVNSASVSTLNNSFAAEHVQAMTSATYGDVSIAFKLAEDFSANPGNGYIGSVGIQATWSDNVTISNAALNGTAGFFRPVIRYLGSASGSCSSDSDLAAAEVESGVTPDVGHDFPAFDQQLWVYPTNSPQSSGINFDTAGLAAYAGVPNLDIPFIYGQPFAFSFGVTLQTGGENYGNQYMTDERTGYLRLRWLGAQVLDANANPVSDFALTSDSGKDWSVSQAIVDAALQIGRLNVLNGTNLVVNGANGTPFNPVFLLSSTNLNLPMSNWVHLDTNNFDFIGNVSFTNATRSGEPQRYYRLLSQ